MRNVIVTGGSRGLGLGIARRLAGEGYRVIAVAQERDESTHCRQYGKRTRNRRHCTSSRSISPRLNGISTLVKTVRKDFGPIYGLVNNAAVSFEGALALMPNSQIEQLVRLNTLSPIVLTKYVVRSMMADGGGRIVNIASIIGFTGYSGLAVLRRDQSIAARLHPIAGAGGRAHGRQCEFGRARIRRYGDDAGTEGRAAAADRRGAARWGVWRKSTTWQTRSNSCSATRRKTSREPCSRSMRATRHETEPSVPPAKAWVRALELTAPIARQPDRIFPAVIEELAAKFGDAPALLSDRECLTYRALGGPVEPICPMGARSRPSQRRGRLPADAQPA